MTVQRYDTDKNDHLIPKDEGWLVAYADHVAEVERALDDDVLAAAHHGQKGYEVGYQKGVKAMRAACIAAAESLDHALLYQATLLAILRTANPLDPAHPAQQP